MKPNRRDSAEVCSIMNGERMKMQNDEAENETCDWLYLPPGLEPESLWALLHDARIASMTSDRMARSLRIEVELAGTIKKRGTVLGSCLRLEFSGVSSLRASMWQPWPGPRPQTRGLSRSEETALVDEYQRKGIETSVDWESLEHQIAASRCSISDAASAKKQDQVALRIIGHIGGQYLTTLFVHASEYVVGANDRPIELREAIRVAEDCWNG